MNRLVILAGGKSTRMGMDKIFLKTGNETFIERIYNNASSCFDDIFISTDSEGHATAIKKLIPKAKLVVDLYDSVGPVGGLLSVYKETKADGFSVTAADTPFMIPELLLHLQDECIKKKKAALILKVGEKMEPLTAFYSKEALKLFEEAIEEKRYSIIGALKGNFETITMEELCQKYPDLKPADIEQAIVNINTREEYEQISNK